MSNIIQKNSSILNKLNVVLFIISGIICGELVNPEIKSRIFCMIENSSSLELFSVIQIELNYENILFNENGISWNSRGTPRLIKLRIESG